MAKATRENHPGAVAADLVEQFMGEHLRHMTGRWAGRPFRLEPWQRDGIIRPVFGSLDPRGKRRYREAVLGVPRWNGKSEIAAAIALACMFTEPAYAGEYYVVATTRQQAGIVFDKAKRMVLADPYLATIAKPYRSVIEIPKTGALFRALPWDADTAQGFHADVCVIDEYHVHRDASMREAMLSGMVGNPNGLLVTISTAGAKRMGPLWELLKTAPKDPRAYVHWVGAPDDADGHDQRVWRAANPAKWITLKMLRDQYRSLPFPVFERLHLNRFPKIGAYDAAIPSEIWMSEANRRQPVYDPDLPAFMAVDAADKRDSSGYIVCQPDANGDYNLWGRVRYADDERTYTDYLALEDDIRTDATGYDVVRIGYDRRQLGRTMAQLADEGFPVEEFPQTNERLCPACQWLYELAATGKLRHGGDPNIAEHIANAAAYERPPLGWRFAKTEPSDDACKIDLAVAAAMAAWMAQAPAAEAWADAW